MAVQSLEGLTADYGISVSADGKLATVKEPKLDLRSPFRPMQGLLGRVMGLLGLVRAR